MPDNNYAALANTIQIEDITYDEQNQTILQKLKDNDERFDNLYVMDNNGSTGYLDDDYIPDDGEDMGWLGYFIGNNKKLQEIHFYKPINNESFYKELCHNKSIKKIHFNGNSSLDEDMIRMLNPFLQNNHNLISIKLNDCEFEVEDTRQLSLAIGSCNTSLKQIDIINNEMVDGQLVDIITAMSKHPQLEELDLSQNGTFGRNECTALSTLLRCTTSQLKTLIIYNSYVNDVGVGLLLPALRGHALQQLNLGNNRTITIRGWKLLSTLLEMPKCNLKELYIHKNNLGDEGALVFAKALTNNSTLKTLSLWRSGVREPEVNYAQWSLPTRIF